MNIINDSQSSTFQALSQFKLTNPNKTNKKAKKEPQNQTYPSPVKSLCFKTYLYDDFNIINFILCATSQWVKIADDFVLPGQMECKFTKGVSGTKTVLFK